MTSLPPCCAVVPPQAEPALLVTLCPGADSRPLLDVRATTLRVAESEVPRRYLLLELPPGIDVLARSLAGRAWSANVEALWAWSPLDAPEAGTRAITVRDPALGLLDVQVAPRPTDCAQAGGQPSATGSAR